MLHASLCKALLLQASALDDSARRHVSLICQKSSDWMAPPVLSAA